MTHRTPDYSDECAWPGDCGGIHVQEFTELDFEHITLQTDGHQQCDSCGVDLSDQPAGIIACPVCNSIQFVELQESAS